MICRPLRLTPSGIVSALCFAFDETHKELLQSIRARSHTGHMETLIGDGLEERNETLLFLYLNFNLVLIT